MNYTRLYSTRIIKTFDEDHSEIMTSLREAYEKDPNLEVQLINYYKGLPVSFNARVFGIDNDTLELDVNPLQAVAISDEYYTFIRSKIFKHDLVAKALYVNIKRKAVALKQLCYVVIMAERRNHIRLKVNPPLEATFMSKQGGVDCKVIELSTAGAIVLIENSGDIQTGEEAQLRFTLQDTDQNITQKVDITAKLITVIEEIKPSRYIFSLSADRTSEKHIAKFLFNRQIEIVRELKYSSDIG
jgi:hypothetical protein